MHSELAEVSPVSYLQGRTALLSPASSQRYRQEMNFASILRSFCFTPSPASVAVGDCAAFTSVVIVQLIGVCVCSTEIAHCATCGQAAFCHIVTLVGLPLSRGAIGCRLLCCWGGKGMFLDGLANLENQRVGVIIVRSTVEIYMEKNQDPLDRST